LFNTFVVNTVAKLNMLK